VVQPFCPLNTASSAQLANALRHFCNSNARQVKLLVVRL